MKTDIMNLILSGCRSMDKLTENVLAINDLKEIIETPVEVGADYVLEKTTDALGKELEKEIKDKDKRDNVFKQINESIRVNQDNIDEKTKKLGTFQYLAIAGWIAVNCSGYFRKYIKAVNEEIKKADKEGKKITRKEASKIVEKKKEFRDRYNALNGAFCKLKIKFR